MVQIFADVCTGVKVLEWRKVKVTPHGLHQSIVQLLLMVVLFVVT